LQAIGKEIMGGKRVRRTFAENGGLSGVFLDHFWMERELIVKDYILNIIC